MRNLMKKSLIVGLLLCVILVTGSCSSDSSEQSDEKEITLGVSLLTQAHPFQVAIMQSIENKSEEMDATADIAIADQDLNRQISAVEDFINKKVNAIIITPVDSDGIKGAIEKANAAGIPVITVDVKANDVEVTSHIATDNYTGGKIAAEAMAKLLNEKGKVVLITYPEVQSVRDRIDGFKEQTVKHEGIEIVTELPGRTREEAKKATEDMLTSNPDSNGVFGFGDDMAIAATNVISERSLDTVVVGFDGLEEARNSVDEDNAFKAVVVQDPEQMGMIAVENAMKAIKGETVEKEVPIVPGLYVNGQGFVEVKIEGDTIDFEIK